MFLVDGDGDVYVWLCLCGKGGGCCLFVFIVKVVDEDFFDLVVVFVFCDELLWDGFGYVCDYCLREVFDDFIVEFWGKWYCYV